MRKAYDYKLTQEFFEKCGFEIITLPPIFNNSIIDFIDQNGYKYSLKYSSYKATIKNGRPLPFAPYNRYCLINLQLWLHKNNKNWKIISEVYSGKTGKIEFHCLDCNNNFLKEVANLLHRKEGCPFCLRKKVSSLNSLQSIRPDIAKLWNQEKNGDITPNDISYMSGKKFWWKCLKCENNWVDEVSKVVVCYKTGCPKCNIKAVNETNNLLYLFPRVAKDWDYNKNYPLTPDKVMAHSGKNYWWKCTICGYSWLQNVDRRTKRDTGKCPACNRTVTSDLNRLILLFPKISEQWDYDKNIGIDLNSISIATDIKYWWKCEYGHSWQATTANRTKHESGCPICSESHGEKKIKEYLEKNNILFNRQVKFKECKYKRRLPFDFGVYINEKLILIEYQGLQHYKPYDRFGGEQLFEKIKTRDQIKKEYCIKNNIEFIEIPFWDYNNIETILDKILLN
jgi:hypothetical protein